MDLVIYLKKQCQMMLLQQLKSIHVQCHFQCDKNIITGMTEVFEKNSKPKSAQQPHHYIK